MLIKVLLCYIFGYIRVSIEGYYIERFINICRNNKIVIWNLKRDKNVKLELNIVFQKADAKRAGSPPHQPFALLCRKGSADHLRERDCDEDGRHHVHHAHFGGARKVQPEADEQHYAANA